MVWLSGLSLSALLSTFLVVAREWQLVYSACVTSPGRRKEFFFWEGGREGDRLSLFLASVAGCYHFLFVLLADFLS